MVAFGYIEELHDASSKASKLSLPPVKKIGLKIDFSLNNVTGPVIRFNGHQPLPFAKSEVINSEICFTRRLSAVHVDCNDIYEMTLDATAGNFKFRPGDAIGVIAPNSSSEVQDILNHLGLKNNGDLMYTLSTDSNLKGVKIPPHIPTKSTLRDVLTNCVDIRAVVKKLFLLTLSNYAENKVEKKILEFLCSTEGSCLYSTHILNKNICLLDIFNIFQSCKPPVETLLAHLPRLLPRPYSIVNSYLKDSSKIKICFSVVRIRYDRKGLTTGWLEKKIKANMSIANRMEELNITGGSKDLIPIYLRKNIAGFSMPENVTTDLILIATGTGIAPFIGFIEERENLRHMEPKTNFGEIYLYYGCRHPDLDFIYSKELNEFVEKGVLKLKTAFSRVENNGIKYVQDALLGDSEHVAKLIADGASIFICGERRMMMAQVRQTLAECLTKHWNQTADQSEKCISDLEKDKRYLVDIWS